MTNAFQWERCDTAGANCADIAGATDPHYTLTDEDAGTTVRVEVTYTNAAGSGRRPEHAEARSSTATSRPHGRARRSPAPPATARR